MVTHLAGTPDVTAEKPSMSNKKEELFWCGMLGQLLPEFPSGKIIAWETPDVLVQSAE
jgi:hypothetical protein